MPKLVFESTSTKKQFEILDFNPAAGTVKLVGPLGTEFESPYSKEQFERMGYVLKQLPDEPAAAPAPPAAPPPPPPVSPVVVA